MASLNRVTIMGNVGRDAELADNGKWAKFPLATKDYRNGEKFTDWHNIIVMGYLVETTKKFISKGSTIYLEGRLKSKKVDGGHVETYVIWDKIELVSRGS